MEKEKAVFDKLMSLGYPCDANGNIPTYEETFDICKNGIIYWVEEKVNGLINKKYIELNSGGIKTEKLLAENYVQAFKEGVNAVIEILKKA